VTERPDPAADTPPDRTVVGAERVRRCEETGGAVGQAWSGATPLVVTTTGRTTGLGRTFAPIRRGDIVASIGDVPTDPGWSVSPVEHPGPTVQVHDERRSYRGRPAAPEETQRLSRTMTRNRPKHDVDTTRTDRDIPVVVLEPVGGSNGE